VRNAVYSSVASQLAFTSQSTETRKLAIHYGSLALGGLHEAIGTFTKTNADGALAASFLLLNQASDWRSWSSLDAGIQSVITSMEPWRHDSVFTQVLDTFLAETRYRRPSQPIMATSEERQYILHNIHFNLQQLRPVIAARPLDLHWIDQLVDYVERLQASEPARTAEEQFSHLYVFRKWIHWVPSQLLDRDAVDAVSLAVVAHLYAMGLALGPLFPDISTHFFQMWTVQPLHNILQRVSGLQQPQQYYSAHTDMEALFRFPHEALNLYRERQPWVHHIVQENTRRSSSMSTLQSNAYVDPGNLSPSFTPAQVYGLPRSSFSLRKRSSSFLEVPVPQGPSHDPHGFTFNTSQWGAMPSPSFPAYEFSAQQEGFAGFQEEGSFLSDYHQGFVTPSEIWT